MKRPTQFGERARGPKGGRTDRRLSSLYQKPVFVHSGALGRGGLVPSAPPSHRGIGRATKGKCLYGQARRLTSPDLHILCRMCTVDNKAPQSNPFTQRIAKNKVPPPGGRWWRQPPKGVHFRRPQGGCMVFPRAKPGCPVFDAKGGIYTGARKGAVPRQRSDTT